MGLRVLVLPVVKWRVLVVNAVKLRLSELLSLVALTTHVCLLLTVKWQLRLLIGEHIILTLRTKLT